MLDWRVAQCGALMLFCVAGCGSDQGDYIRTALSACQMAVTARLKSPRTAQFATVTESRIGTIRYAERYEILSYVDAQNAFGALLRMPYRCEVEFTGAREKVAQVINVIFAQ